MGEKRYFRYFLKKKDFLLILNLFEIVFFVYSLFAKEDSWLSHGQLMTMNFGQLLKDGSFYKTVMTCTRPGAHQSETEEGQLK